MATPRRYAANHKPWDHVGNLTPNLSHSEGKTPHFPSRVASWLPVNGGANAIAMGFIARWDQNIGVEDYIVVSMGKVVAADCLGSLLPAGVRKAWDAAGSSDTVLTYTATDVTWRTTDLGTGVFVTEAKTYTKAQLELQLEQMGYLTPTEGLADFVSRPIGVAAGNYLRSAGSDLANPATFAHHNYKMQDYVPVLCDYVVRYPWVPTGDDSVTVPAFSDAFDITNLDDENAAGVFGSLSTFQTEMDRYDDDSNTDVVGFALRHAPSATHTDRTPITITRSAVDVTSTVLLRQRSSIKSLSQDGDWFFDAEVSVLWFYEAGGNALPTLLTAADVVAFYHYRSAPTSVTTYACIYGNLCAGDFVTYDKFSNLVKLSEFVAGDVVTSSDGNPSDAELAVIMNQVLRADQETIGQVLGWWEYPRDGLEKVRTAYASLGTQDQMPGSANKGFSDAVHYSSAADVELIVNLIKR